MRAILRAFLYSVSKKKEREGGYTFTHASFQAAAGGGVLYILYSFYVDGSTVVLYLVVVQFSLMTKNLITVITKV